MSTDEKGDHAPEPHAGPHAEPVRREPPADGHAEPEAAPAAAAEPAEAAPAAPAEPHPPVVEEHAHAPAAEAHAAEPVHEPASVSDEAAPVVEPAAAPQPAPAMEPAAESEPAPASYDHASAAVAAPAAAAVTAAAAHEAPQARPIWSDHGDAPFDEGETTPAYARGRKARRTKAKKGGGGAMAEFFDIVKTIVYALLIALVLRILFFQPFTIPSASMEPNLYQGDYIVVSKWSYGYSRHSIPFSPDLFEGRIMGSPPERGDIVVFKWPRDNRTDYIKRVIGLPGDQIQMRAGVLYVNGEAVRTALVNRADVAQAWQDANAQLVRETLPGGRSYLTQDYGLNASDLDDTPVFEVPEGHYFMMGDNRDNSIDSRVETGVGLVPEENLVGEAQVILFSWEPGVSLLNPVTWFTHVRTSRFFTDLE